MQGATKNRATRRCLQVRHHRRALEFDTVAAFHLSRGHSAPLPREVIDMLTLWHIFSQGTSSFCKFVFSTLEGKGNASSFGTSRIMNLSPENKCRYPGEAVTRAYNAYAISRFRNTQHGELIPHSMRTRGIFDYRTRKDVPYMITTIREQS